MLIYFRFDLRQILRNSSPNDHFIFFLDTKILFHPNHNLLEFHISPKLRLLIVNAMKLPIDLIDCLLMNL